MLRQPALAGQFTSHRAEQLAVQRRCVAAGERLDLLAAEPELSRALSPRRLEHRRIDGVVLAPPRIERGGLRRPSAGQSARFELGLDLRATP